LKISAKSFSTNKGNYMDKFDSIEIPKGIKLLVFKWDDWHECYFKGSTLCYPLNKGGVAFSEYIDVESDVKDHKAAMEFAEKLREMGYKNAS
jgi:hypothetical protein